MVITFSRASWNILGFVAGTLLACAGPRGLPDGTLCAIAERCASGPCNSTGFDCSEGSCQEHGYCPGSGCSDDDDCEPNWRCELVQTDEASFLGIIDKDEYDYLCVPQCDPCPEQFKCDGTRCVHDGSGTTPEGLWVGIAAPESTGVGVLTTLSASVFSELDPGQMVEVASYVWYFHDGTQATGEEIEHVFTPAESIDHDMLDYFFATVEITDVAGNVASSTAQIRRCNATGEACDGSYNCCDGFQCTPTADPEVSSCQPYTP